MKSRNTLTCALAVLAMSTLSACNSSEPLAVSKTDVPATQNGQTTPGAQTAPGAATTTTPATTATQSVPTPGTATQSGTAPVPAPTPGAQANVSPVPGNAQTAKLRFAPIVGAPIAAATPLSQRLSAIAKQKGITLGTAADTNNTHVMKGYFSALPDGNQTTIIYVWDVLDPGGNAASPHTGAGKSTWRGRRSMGDGSSQDDGRYRRQGHAGLFDVGFKRQDVTYLHV